MPSTLRWLAIQTSTPARTRACAMSACMSEKPVARSGRSARIRSTFALVKAETRGFSWRARAGRTVNPEMPTMRCSSPRRYSTSVGSSVRQTMRCGYISTRLQPREVLFEGFLRVAHVALAAVGFQLAQVHAADLARQGLGQLGHELDPAHALVRCEPLPRKGEDLAREFRAGRPVLRQRDEGLGH